MAASDSLVLRRSSRVPMNVPILVTSVAEPHTFSQMCETMVVSAHGCSLRSTAKLDAGVPVHFRTDDGKWAIAHIVDCQPNGNSGWVLGARLDKPTNFWGLTACPEDWTPQNEKPSPNKLQVVKKPVNDLHAVIAELVEPLHAAVSEIRQKLEKRDSNRSRFEISLSYIPPEVQEKLHERLRDELRVEVLHKTRLQSEAVMEATKEAVGQRIKDARNQFRNELASELRKVEERAQGLSDEITAAVQQHIDTGEERLEKKLAEVNLRLEKRSDEFFRALQQKLAAEHCAYRHEVEHIHAGVASEVADIQTEVGNIGKRLGALDKSAHYLESEMERQLSRVSTEIISGARSQLESALDVVLKDLGTRNAKDLEGQLDDACHRLRDVQKEIEHGVSELVKTKVADGLVNFGQTIEALSEDAVTRWRGGLARDLNSMTEILARKCQVENSGEEALEEPSQLM